VQDYGQHVERLSRCRNSFTHGGSINLKVATTVHLFAKPQATHITRTGLWAVLSGCEVKEAHDKRRADDDTWRNGISTAAFGGIHPDFFPSSNALRRNTRTLPMYNVGPTETMPGGLDSPV